MVGECKKRKGQENKISLSQNSALFLQVTCLWYFLLSFSITVLLPTEIAREISYMDLEYLYSPKMWAWLEMTLIGGRMNCKLEFLSCFSRQMLLQNIYCIENLQLQHFCWCSVTFHWLKDTCLWLFSTHHWLVFFSQC